MGAEKNARGISWWSWPRAIKRGAHTRVSFHPTIDSGTETGLRVITRNATT